MLKGGETGRAVVPGKPEESLLIKAVGYLDEPKMPPKQKLSEADIAKLTRWVAMGAPWAESNSTPNAALDGGFQVTSKQSSWWAYQPVKDRTPPIVQEWIVATE